MANSDTTASAQASVESPEVTLEEFCTRLSDRKVDGRVELIHGFAFTECKAGHFKDTESAFKDRLEAFANKPV